ncbi:hypothetical protein [Desulfosporosinus shakirovi]|nr:hypothetical protein [Desulfosporosinus sp. SRJS8]MCB8818794.1 hypothetical protein [Desulfosporosinus sp. SRJS8]
MKLLKLKLKLGYVISQLSMVKKGNKKPSHPQKHMGISCKNGVRIILVHA